MGAQALGSRLAALSPSFSPPKQQFSQPINKGTRSQAPETVSHVDSMVLIRQLYRPEAIRSARPGRLFLIILALFAIFSTATCEKPISNFFEGAKRLLHCIVKVCHLPSRLRVSSPRAVTTAGFGLTHWAMLFLSVFHSQARRLGPWTSGQTHSALRVLPSAGVSQGPARGGAAC